MDGHSDTTRTPAHLQILSPFSLVSSQSNLNRAQQPLWKEEAILSVNKYSIFIPSKHYWKVKCCYEGAF